MKIGIILGLIILILAVGFVILKPGKEQPGPTGEEKTEQTPEEIFLEEQQLIEAWIIEQGLNQYGDPKDTVYIGGTPLFDERTGQSINKYEYILRKHPDKPWLK